MSDRINTAIIGWRMGELQAWCRLVGIDWKQQQNGVILMCPGSATCGTCLDRVILVGFKPGEGGSPLIAAAGLEWYNCCIRTKRPLGMTDEVMYIERPVVFSTLEELVK